MAFLPVVGEGFPLLLAGSTPSLSLHSNAGGRYGVKAFWLRPALRDEQHQRRSAARRPSSPCEDLRAEGGALSSAVCDPTPGAGVIPPLRRRRPRARVRQSDCVCVARLISPRSFSRRRGRRSVWRTRCRCHKEAPPPPPPFLPAVARPLPMSVLARVWVLAGASLFFFSIGSLGGPRRRHRPVT